MVIHFDGYTNPADLEDVPEGLTDCGVNIPKNYYFSSNWDKVSCKRCLRQKNNILKSYKINEDAIVKEMGDMADFFNKN